MSVTVARRLIHLGAPVLVAIMLAGCGPVLSFPTHRFEAIHGHVSPQATIGEPVRLCDARGNTIKTLAKRGAGPWRSPDGKTLYFVRLREHQVESPQTGTETRIRGELCRADPTGRNQFRLRLPEDFLPCEVKVSPTGRYLAIAGFTSSGSGSIDDEALALLPRDLYVLGLNDRSWQLIGTMLHPGGWEFAWSPKQDLLAFAGFGDTSAMWVIAEQLALRERVRSAQQEQPASAPTTSQASTRSQPTDTAPAAPGAVIVHDLSRFHPTYWYGTDLLSKAPRSTAACLWLPNMKTAAPLLQLHRPYYAGFHWMPDGRHLLLFGIDGEPRLLTDDESWRWFRCHCWDVERRRLERIPVPRADAFAAYPSPGKGRQLLWICGSYVHELILTDNWGRRPRHIASEVVTVFRPHWTDEHTFCFIKQDLTEQFVDETRKAPPRLVTFDTKAMRAVERRLAPTFAPDDSSDPWSRWGWKTVPDNTPDR